MAMHGKKYQAARQKVQQEVLTPKKVFDKIKDLSFAKFDESIDVNVNLGIDPTKGEQVVRGSVILPHSFGKQLRVVVFAKGDHAEQAAQAGADFIGSDDLIEKIQGGWLDFDVAVSTPDLMGKVGKLAKVLGPKGLLPNKKLCTVTLDVGPVVSDLKKGRRFFRNDKSGLVHFSVGKTSFDVEKLMENLSAFFKALNAAKPASAKGKYLKKISLSSSMGVGLQVNPDEIFS